MASMADVVRKVAAGGGSKKRGGMFSALAEAIAKKGGKGTTKKKSDGGMVRKVSNKVRGQVDSPVRAAAMELAERKRKKPKDKKSYMG